MDTAKTVSVRALRTLTYNILAKAILSAVMLICTLAGILALRSSAPDMALIELISLVAMAAEFINIISCVMSVGGITGLSGKFVAMHRIMVLVLILGCVMVLMITANLWLGYVNNGAAAAASLILLVLYVAETLLVGVAFLFCTRGFGEVLREDGDSGSAAVTERLGTIYLWCNAVGLVVLACSGGERTLLLALAGLYLAKAVLELLMYRRVSDSAFRIWRKRSFDMSA